MADSRHSLNHVESREFKLQLVTGGPRNEERDQRGTNTSKDVLGEV